MMECRNIDELMMEFIYRELDPAKADEFRTHVGGCARCNAELGSLQATRQALRNLPELEPSPMVTTRLLEEAARRQTRAVAVTPVGAGEAGQGLWAWLGSLLRPMAMHPAFAAVAALALVGGVAGFLTLRGNVKSEYRAPVAAAPEREAELERAAATPTGGELRQRAELADKAGADSDENLQETGKNVPAAVAPGSPAPADGYAYKDSKDPAPETEAEKSIGRTGRQASPYEEQTARGGAGGTGEDDGEKAEKPAADLKKAEAKPDPAPPPAEVEAEEPSGEPSDERKENKKTPDRSKGGGGKAPAQDPVARQPAVTVAKEPKPAQPQKSPPKEPARKAKQDAQEQDKSVREDEAGGEASGGDDGVDATGTAEDMDEAPAPMAPSRSQGDSTNTKKKAKSKDEPGKLHGQARAKAASGDCGAVGDIKKRIYRSDPNYYQRRVRNDPDLAKCDAPGKAKKQPTKSAPPADSTRDAESIDKSSK